MTSSHGGERGQPSQADFPDQLASSSSTPLGSDSFPSPGFLDLCTRKTIASSHTGERRNQSGQSISSGLPSHPLDVRDQNHARPPHPTSPAVGRGGINPVNPLRLVCLVPLWICRVRIPSIPSPGFLNLCTRKTLASSHTGERRN